MRGLMDVGFTVKLLVCSGILSIVASIRNVQVQQVTLSSSVFFICRMGINSNSTTGDIWWTKDGKDIFKRKGLYEFIVPAIRDRIRIHDSVTFQLSDVRKDDRGLYVCSVPSTNGEAQDLSTNWTEVARIYLDIIEAPTITQHSPERNVIREGSDLTLFCQWTANPRANITWHRGLTHEQLMVQPTRNTDVSGKTTEHTLFSSTSSLRGIQIRGPKPRISKLVFRNFRREDVDVYSCRVSNSIGVAVKRMAVLIRGTTIFVHKPKNHSVNEYTTIQLDCNVVSDDPVISYTWLKDGHPVSQYPMLSHRYKIHSNGTLQLPNISRQDAGIYVCQPQTAKNYQNTSPHFATNGSSSLDLLSFSPVNYDHPMNEDGFGDERQGSQVAAHVKVKFLPESHMTKRQPIYLGFNGPGRLPCVIYSYPPVQLLEWRKVEDYRAYQNAFPPTSPNQTFPVNMGTPRTWSVVASANQVASSPERNSHRTTFWYEWDSVTAEDAWKYQCRGQNVLGWGQWSESVDVLVKELPKFRKTPPSTLSVAMNSVISLDCEADGDPPPEISWTRTKRINELEEVENHSTPPQSSPSLSPTRHRPNITGKSSEWMRLALPKTSFVTSEGKMRLFVTKPEDIDGIFHCVASNPLGKIVASVNLTILNLTVHPKHTAAEFTVTIDTQTFGAWLSWDAPGVGKRQLYVDDSNDGDDGDTGDCHYVVYHKIVRSEEQWKSARVQPDGVTQVWLGGLVPDEWYAFQVTLWCFVNESAITGQVKYAKTDAYRPSPDISSRHNSPAFAELHPPPIKSDKDCILTAPDHLQFIKMSVTGKQEEERITGLQWKQRTFEINTSHRINNRRMDSLQPPLHYRVEYKISMPGVKFKENGTIASSFRTLENALNNWDSLSPVEAPRKAYYFYAGPKETLDQNSLFGPLLSAWKIPSTPINEHVEGIEGVYFRVRSYGLMCASEPSKELEVDTPYLRSILTTLQNTVAHEQTLLQVVSLTSSLGDTDNESSISSPSVIRTPSVFQLSEPFWHILSFVLLGIVISCFLGLLLYIVYRSRCLRKPPNFGCTNNVLTNQFQSDIQCSDVPGCREAQSFGRSFARTREKYEKASSCVEYNKNVSSSEATVRWNNKFTEPPCIQAVIGSSALGQAVNSPSSKQSELIYYLPVKNEQSGSAQSKEMILWADSHVSALSPFTQRREIEEVVHLFPPVSKHKQEPRETMASAQNIVLTGLPKTEKMESERDLMDPTEQRGLSSCNTTSTNRPIVRNDVWIDCGHDVQPRPGNGDQRSQILNESTPPLLSALNTSLLNPIAPSTPTYVIFPFEPVECPGDKQNVQIEYLSYVSGDISNETPVSSLCPCQTDPQDHARKHLWNETTQASEL